ncbi:hypothetical protein [Symmachiella dynata]|uniref:Uncharacterized protein n=1 Tax=Symmachiella dynata TaxID=2527995 RepID=A0A517ZVJ3_9PLAN|nr:hypothetical protein [Symmachiella dynata]QDT50822.1 hypothetical protein Pan258_49040 [Symmachiella dynata]QDU46480.1 hypothetical protein Mal52_50010 [Symmachiella dynata]
MRKIPSHSLERVDAFFAAQQPGKRISRVLLWSGLIVGGLLWLPTVLPDQPTVDDTPLTVVDPFVNVPSIGESTNTVHFEQRN